ncbi:hypothetical protein [Kribbella swartbergensis]
MLDGPRVPLENAAEVNHIGDRGNHLGGLGAQRDLKLTPVRPEQPLE